MVDYLAGMNDNDGSNGLLGGWLVLLVHCCDKLVVVSSDYTGGVIWTTIFDITTGQSPQVATASVLAIHPTNTQATSSNDFLHCRS